VFAPDKVQVPAPTFVTVPLVVPMMLARLLAGAAPPSVRPNVAPEIVPGFERIKFPLLATMLLVLPKVTSPL
jgi:hypothetical protein